MIDDDDVEPDVGLCFKSTPPTMTPLSERAKAVMDLPEGVDAGIFLDTDAQTSLEIFGDEYVMVTMPEDYTPDIMMSMFIQELH